MSNRQQRRAFRKLANVEWGPWEERRLTAEQVTKAGFPGMAAIKTAFVNMVYAIQVYECPTPWGEVTQLTIRRHDGTMARSWSDLQRIKNEIVGRDKVAVEVFPAETDLVDQANCMHLWVLPEGVQLPFGLQKGVAAWGKPAE